MKSGTILKRDNLGKIAAQIRNLTGLGVLVGIPAEKTDRPGDSSGMTNAAIGYVQENGSPAANIPERPFLAPGIKDATDTTVKYFRQAGEAAMKGDRDLVDRCLAAAGIAAVSAVQARIRDGIPPALAPATVRARRRRSKGSSYRRKASSASDTTPLIDTHEMLQSITYIVRDGKGPGTPA